MDKPVNRKLVEKALDALLFDNPKKAQALLVKSLGLIQVKPEEHRSYTEVRPLLPKTFPGREQPRVQE